MKEKECMKEKYAAFIGKTFTAKDLDSAYSLYSSTLVILESPTSGALAISGGSRSAKSQQL